MVSFILTPGELLRKKRREKGGHKDPLLEEISLLQEEVMKQISTLRSEHEAAEKKRTELETVALILGLGPSDRPCGRSSAAKEPEVGATLSEKNKQPQRSTERESAAGSSPRKVGGPTGSSPESPNQLQLLDIIHISKVLRRFLNKLLRTRSHKVGLNITKDFVKCTQPSRHFKYGRSCLPVFSI